ncbi:glycosyltransferase [Sulfurovum sp. NBC37-1]|uniref:glycosyltransferase n=1 Tax=Sulfurovum sp. (strain NBC37-1) TaxID=387093 RepID=UPI000158783B|nr:glycosyltransferase [Sulfurovum sp. NBC37-1]BAF71058.1 polysaccharide biosynthesis protein [Sulfurovum sp. NBC37-1]
MIEIILITSSFPYYPGEQFLETEVEYYPKRANLTIMPITAHPKYRNVPNGIKVDQFLCKKSVTLVDKLYYLIKSMGTRLFYKEFRTQVGTNTKRIKQFLFSMYTYQRFYELFDVYFHKKEKLNSTVVYTYWNTEATYALQSLKKKYGYKLVSRIHGMDLYQERRKDGYMPLKHLFTHNIDKVFTITESANTYLNTTYGFSHEILKVYRLGVNDYGIYCKPGPDHVLSIVSCSFLVKVKRVDKIIDALHALANRFHAVTFIWNHIGSGPLEKTLKDLANKKLSQKENIIFNFIGQLTNQEVYKFYKENKVDVLINVSESEGVPVSIMEAMSCHIPIIAPNIGGISEMIDNKVNGVLLNEKCEVNEIVDSLGNIHFFKSEVVREKSHSIFLKKYNAQTNYNNFINDLKALVDTKVKQVI